MVTLKANNSDDNNSDDDNSNDGNNNEDNNNTNNDYSEFLLHDFFNLSVGKKILLSKVIKSARNK